MRQYVIESAEGGIDGLKIVERESPKPGAGQVLVRVRAASLNYRDLLLASGTVPLRRTPLVPLSDGAGEVIDVGGGVTPTACSRSRRRGKRTAIRRAARTSARW